jgi:flagellin-like hook-associated protein FlgL
MAALGHLNRTNGNLESTFSRISSGLRINKAGDDAAGLGLLKTFLLNSNLFGRRLGIRTMVFL